MPLLSRLRPEANDCWRPGALAPLLLRGFWSPNTPPNRNSGEEAISLDEEAAALQAAAAAKFAERSAAAAAEFAAESAAAAEKSRLATARRRRVHRQRVAFQAKISRLVAHEDAAVAELEEEERLEPLAAPEAAPPVSLFSTDWGAVDIDQALAFGSPEPLPSLFSG
ncbi:hypothetical protein B0T26DRAFT_680621 [Lasiosphaeria miniovina]|uniref:Uncharacterized protein n=1 Tax=Lasiosphaeria miniovina TaxID=1954250 RepID=A0AA40DKZ1_9PEZI|nr:uncharacterized protein B0T26DRAFT_680621 [Lasiosphaeria miniovina]KAK0707045.1 hypothetical protein B0T26DRAFT_680621 [Lasiosphaeria miniovina]